MSPARDLVRRWARAVAWYLREVTGEADYERYLVRHQQVHAEAAVLTRRQFERRRWEQREHHPGNRCC